MRIFISLDVDQIQAAPVTLYLNQIQMKLSSKELNKLINELLWAQQSIHNIGENHGREEKESIGIPRQKIGSSSSINIQA